MKFPCKTFTTLCKFSLRVMGFFAVWLLLLFFAEDSLASKTLYRYTLVKHIAIGVRSDGLNEFSDSQKEYHWSLSADFFPYEWWPFLQSLQHTSNNFGAHNWWPYGYSTTHTDLNHAPYFYSCSGQFYTGDSVSDDWTEDDVNELINDAFNALSPSQKAALSGRVISGSSSNGDTNSKFSQFTTKSIGTESGGGVVTYGVDGSVIVSYPDNTGYASGYKALPDGTFTPVYYTVQDGVVTEYADITPPSYDSLTVDPSTGHYTLDIPNYNQQLDKIINKMDRLSDIGDNIKVVLSEVTPEVNVNVPAPQVTVEAPQVTVNIPDDLQVDLSTVESKLTTIHNDLTQGAASQITEPVDFSPDQEEQTMTNQYRQWETNIPLIGEGCDFGLTALFGRIPQIGTEYVWMDLEVAPAQRGNKSARGFLSGLRIRIDLNEYRDILLGVRGWLIIFEALFFVFAVYRNVREALQV